MVIVLYVCVVTICTRFYKGIDCLRENVYTVYKHIYKMLTRWMLCSLITCSFINRFMRRQHRRDLWHDELWSKGLTDD